MTRDKFWMVLGNGVPTMRHESLKIASDEAGRLASCHPGQEFTVLEAVVTCRKQDVVWERHEYYGPSGVEDLPF